MIRFWLVYRHTMVRYLIFSALTVTFVLGCVYFADQVYPKLVATSLQTIDKVVVKKAERKLFLMKEGEIVKVYSIALGGDPIGHKEQEGDSRTPEGDYRIDWRNPDSKFHLSLHISYPNVRDQSQAERGGYSPGGAIMIHGRPNWISWLYVLFEHQDWTNGCIAVNNVEMEEIWNSVPNGTPITILP